MKVQVRRIDPAVMAERSGSAESARGDPDAPVWMIEESSLAEPADVRRTGVDRSLCISIALLGALVGFGFIGRFAGDGDTAGTPRPSVAIFQAPGSPGVTDTAIAHPAVADMPLLLISPVEGARIESTTVEVVGVANRKLGRVRLAIMLGGAALGWKDVEVPGPGTLTVTLPVFAPPVRIQVELVATILDGERTAPGSPVLRVAPVRRPMWLHPGGPIGLWPAHLVPSRTGMNLIVSGYGPVSVGRVHIRAVTQDGRPVAAASADVTVNGARPGSPGGYALGLGSFEASVGLGVLAGAGPLRVEVDWRDPVGGEWGTAVLTLAADETSSPQRRRPGH